MKLVEFFSRAKPVEVVSEFVQQTPAEREADLLARIRGLDSQIDLLAMQARDFRTRHTTVAGGNLCFTADTVDATEKLQAEWIEITSAAGDAVLRRDAVLAEWSSLHIANQETQRV